MPGDQIRLLALDGGGVRGLSSLMILRQLMETVNPESPPEPCEYFDMIGGTSTGGLIAIMLGRLRMTLDDCIKAYTALSDKVFEKKRHRVKINGKLQGRFDAAELEKTIKQLLRAHKHDEDALLKDVDAPCKVFVCATSKETSSTVCLTSYRSPRSAITDLLNATTIWQACRATSAATSFFDPIAIGPFDEEFVDGALGANNPIFHLWHQAEDVWGEQLSTKLQCVVSIGTGIPNLRPVRDDALGVWATLKDLATETEATAQQFHRDKSHLDDEGRYYRFNVDQGLEDIGLQESRKKKEIAAATRRYVASQTVFRQMQAFASQLPTREYRGPYRTKFSLLGVPIAHHFVGRPADTDEIDQCLLPRRSGSQHGQHRKIFVLHGLGGIGKTQLAVDFARRHKGTFSSIFWLDGRSEDRLRQSLAGCAKWIPEGQIPDRSRTGAASNEADLDVVVTDVLDWLARPDNVDWLLIFDNVDHDHEQGSTTSEFDVLKYLPSDHGSALITTRLSRLAQLGDAKQLKKTDDRLSQAIFEKWSDSALVMDEAGKKLLGLLDGLPLALAQAAAYCRETGCSVASYVRLYEQQWDDLMVPDATSGSSPANYGPRTVGTTWTLSFKAVETRSENAANLLRLWAFIANRDVWHGLLQPATTGQRWWPKWLTEMACNEVQFMSAVKLLRSYSLVEAQESVPDSYVVHPVVHKWMSHIQDASSQREFSRLAIIVLGTLAPKITERDYWVLQRRLLAHVDRCSWWIDAIHGPRWVPDDTLLLDSMDLLGHFYWDQGRPTKAEAMFQRALQRQEKALGSDHPQTLTTVNNLGGVYQDQGRLTEAEAMFQRALRGKEKAHGPDHPQNLITVHNLGVIYQDQGRLTEAKAMFQRALQGKEKAHGPDHPQTLTTVNNLGVIYGHQGRLTEAEAMFQRVLQGMEKAHGPDHPQTLIAVHNLGGVYRRHGRLNEAEAMMQRALQGKEKAHGPDHPETLTTVHSLGGVYRAQGRLTEAEAMFQRALQGQEKVHGPDHPLTQAAARSLARLYESRDRQPETEARARVSPWWKKLMRRVKELVAGVGTAVRENPATTEPAEDDA